MSEHERGLAVSGLSIIVAILLGYFGLRPLLDSYHQNVLRSQALAAEVSDLQARKTQLTALQQDLIKYKDQVNQLAAAVPPGTNYPELLVQLSALAAKGQVTISSVLPGRDTSNPQTVPVTITVRGTYPQLLSFAQAIEVNLQPIAISSMSLIGSSASGQQAQIQPITATIQMTFARTAGKGGS